MEKLLISKIVTWLDDRDSHSIYDHGSTAKSFTEATGEQPCWPTHTAQATQAAIHNRGLGGYVNEPESGLTCYGYEIAYSLAMKYANFRSNKMGRGFMFHDCYDALKRASE